MADSGLFTIETNTNFSWIALADDEKEFSRIQRLLSSFFDVRAMDIKKIIKRNVASDVFWIQSPQGDFILRETNYGDAVFLESQAALVNQLNFRNILRPVKTRLGIYVAKADDKASILYPYLQGSMFSGNEDLMGVITECISLLKELRQVAPPHLPVVMPVLRTDLEGHLDTLLGVRGLGNTILGSFLNPATISFIADNALKIKSWAQSAANLNLSNRCVVTHNDLNHANLITDNKSTFILDIEDICIGSPDIALSHCVFKLFRHSVYTNFRSVSSLADDLDKVLALSGNNAFQINTRKHLFDYGAFRIFNDIGLIMDRIMHKAVPVPTDLEKKVYNLFELEQMCLN